MYAFMIDPAVAEASLTSPESLKEFLNADMTLVNNIIREKIQSAVALIPHLSSYIIRSGGKRLRPLMSITGARIFSDQPSIHVHKLAAAIEFIHTASLLHDDVVDDSDLRRNQPSANSVWGNPASVLVGDFLLARSFELLAEIGNTQVTHLMSKAASTISEGEVLQLSEAHNLEMSQDTYLSIVHAKTAQLFATGMRCGGLLGGANETEAQALFDYGTQIGILFQLVDDNLDYLVESEYTGKRQGNDFREGKVTLPVLIAYAKADQKEQTFWQRTLVDLDQNQNDLAQALTILNHHKVFDQIYSLCSRYVERAQTCLHALPNHVLKGHLGKLIEYSLHRCS